MRKRDEYVKERDDVAARMTPEQIAEAQRRAREWKQTILRPTPTTVEPLRVSPPEAVAYLI